MPAFESIKDMSDHYSGIPMPAPIAVLALAVGRTTSFEYQLLFQPKYGPSTKYPSANQLVIQYLKQGENQYVKVEGEGSRELNRSEVESRDLLAMMHATKEIDSLVAAVLYPLQQSFEQVTFKSIGTFPPVRLIEYPLSDIYRRDFRLAVRVLEYVVGDEGPVEGLKKIVTHVLPERKTQSTLLPKQSVSDSPENDAKPLLGNGDLSERKPQSSSILVTSKMPTREELSKMSLEGIIGNLKGK